MEDYKERLIEKINSKMELIDRDITEHQAMGGYPNKISDYSPLDREHFLNHYRNMIEAYTLIEHYRDVFDEDLESNINLGVIHEREKALLFLFSQSTKALKELEKLRVRLKERENKDILSLDELFFRYQT